MQYGHSLFWERPYPLYRAIITRILMGHLFSLCWLLVSSARFGEAGAFFGHNMLALGQGRNTPLAIWMDKVANTG